MTETNENPKWWYAFEGQQYGPFKADVIRGLLSEKKIDDTTLVWCEEIDNWSLISEISEFRQSLSMEPGKKKPPPLPQTFSDVSHANIPETKDKLWKATGKVKIIPYLGGLSGGKKSPYVGDWKYDSGILTRKIPLLARKKRLNLREKIKSIGIQGIRGLSDWKTSREITPAHLTAWMTNPIVGSMLDKSKMKKLSKRPLVTVTLYEDVIDMYVTEAILVELLNNCELWE